MTMTQQCLAEAPRREQQTNLPNHWMPTILKVLGLGLRKRRDFVDLRELSPYLQRDLGFVDGRKPFDD
jgi:hypothetical protein